MRLPEPSASRNCAFSSSPGLATLSGCSACGETSAFCQLAAGSMAVPADQALDRQRNRRIRAIRWCWTSTGSVGAASAVSREALPIARRPRRMRLALWSDLLTPSQIPTTGLPVTRNVTFPIGDTVCF